MLSEHSAAGSAHTQQGVQKERPSLFDLTDRMRALTVPTLIVTGDEDWPCLVPGVFMKRTIPSSALLTVPNTGHTVNLEEPDTFNAALAGFFAQVDAGRWPMRDPPRGERIESPGYSEAPTWPVETCNDIGSELVNTPAASNSPSGNGRRIMCSRRCRSRQGS